MNSPRIRSRSLNNTTILLLVTIALFIAIYVISMIVFKDAQFGKFSVFFNLINTKAYLLVLALALTVAMIPGSIDISVGGVTGLVSMTISMMLSVYGLNAGLSIPAALAIGLAFGVMQGYLVAYMEIQPFIITLTGMFFARGLVSVINSQSVAVTDATFKNWVDLKFYIPFLYNIRGNGTYDYAYLTLGAVIALAVLILMILLLKFTRFGRSLYASGGNRQSAMLMGINVKKTIFTAHVLSGLLAGIGGLLFTLMFPAGNSMLGRGYEIDAIAAAVIGGTMLNGGVGLPIGTFFGVMINAVVARVVPMMGLTEPSWPSVITAVFLLVFIVLQSLLVIAGNKEGGIRQILPEWLKFREK